MKCCFAVDLINYYRIICLRFILSFVKDAMSYENVHPEPKSSSGDATSRLVEAIERLVAQNAQQQQG